MRTHRAVIQGAANCGGSILLQRPMHLYLCRNGVIAGRLFRLFHVVIFQDPHGHYAADYSIPK